MNIQDRIEAFSLLGQKINSLQQDEIQFLYEGAIQTNPWFIKKSIDLALSGISNFLNKEMLTKWTSNYTFREDAKNVGVSMAGNIPLVGFHDYLCVLISGNKLTAKLSTQDSFLLTQINNWLIKINPSFNKLVSFEDRLNNVDAMIATGSDNTARYFEYYFRKKPNIIRKNRSSVAIIMGEENKTHLTELGNDVFSYFGLGCRNISTLFVPEGYRFDNLFETWEEQKEIVHHHKYANNYDYQKSILLVNQTPFFDNGFLLITEKEQLVSPISVLHYQTYSNQNELKEKIKTQSEKIQCMVSANGWFEGSVPFGKAQTPELSDYADGIDTMDFLTNLNQN